MVEIDFCVCKCVSIVVYMNNLQRKLYGKALVIAYSLISLIFTECNELVAR